MSHLNTPPVRKRAPLTTRSSRFKQFSPGFTRFNPFSPVPKRFKACIGSRAPHCRTVLQNGHDKTQNASHKKRSIISQETIFHLTRSDLSYHKKRSIMEHSPGLSLDTKSLRNCSGNQAKVLLKGHRGINCHSQ